MLGRELGAAVDGRDDASLRRVLGHLSWCWRQAGRNEQFAHFAADVLNSCLRSANARASLFARLDRSMFTSLQGMFRNIYGENEAKRFEQEFESKRRAGA